MYPYQTHTQVEPQVQTVTEKSNKHSEMHLSPLPFKRCSVRKYRTLYTSYRKLLYSLVLACKYVRVYFCLVCLFVSWCEGKALVSNLLAECLLFNLSSVKLTYLRPLTTDVWPAKPVPLVVVCALRNRAHTAGCISRVSVNISS